MKGIPQISNSEWEVMKVLWAGARCTANEVVEALAGTTAWQPKTIRTLINRLVNKGAAGYEIEGKDKKTYYYFATVAEKDCIRSESQMFLKRVFSGSSNRMLANFFQECDLTPEDIEELKRILDKKKG